MNEKEEFVPPPEAPVFEPTEEEWADPLGYIAKIRPIAEKTGICKVRPPPDWQPPFAVDVDDLRFVPRKQRLNELEAKTRIKLNFLDNIAKYWELQGCRLRIPNLSGKTLDLFGFSKVVNDLGGFEKCTRDRNWNKVAVKLGYPASKCLGSHLLRHYERILWPYDVFQAGAAFEPAQPLPEGDCQDKDYVQHGIPGRQAIKPPGGGGYSRRAKRRAPDEPLVMDIANNPELKKLQLYGPGPKFAGLGLVADGKQRPGCPDLRQEPMETDTKEQPQIRRTPRTPKKVEPPPQPLGPSTNYLDMYMCHVCNKGDNEDTLLLCDGCDDSFHTFCLLPPLPEVPKGDWRCPKCVAKAVSKPQDPFGFESSRREYTLQTFGEMADQFKADYFNMPVHMVQPEQVEKEFWRLVTAVDEDVCVCYGADIHSLDHGSGFPCVRNGKEIPPEDEEYAVSGWNLNNLPTQEGSVLSHINADISGMKVPWMYVGMCFSTFCWHVEDHWSYSINYMHWGEPKTWYGVPGSSAHDFETVMRQQAPELFEAQPDLLHQLVTIMSPTVLMKNDIPVVRTNQCAGEFVITYPRAYHAGFNQGYNFAEAVNFAPADWLPIGRQSIDYYRNLRRLNVFSHEELVCKMAADPDSLDLNMAAAVHKEMLHMVEEEKKLRKKMLERGTVNAEREAFELVPDDERQCDNCKTTCFLSAVTCPCKPNKLVCIKHVEDLCECHSSNHCLRYRYTLDELPAMLHRLKVRAESFDNWANNVKNALEATQDCKLEVAQLKEMIVEADEKRFPDNELLQQLVASVTEAERCAGVAAQLVSKKHSTRQRSSGDSKYITKLTLDELQGFMEQVESLPCLIREADLIQNLLNKIENFQEDAKDALHDAIPDSEKLQKLLQDGASLDIDLPEIPKLKQELQQAHWLDDVRGTLSIPNSVSLDTLRKLIDSGVSLVPHPAVEKAMAELQELLTVSERWEEKAKICLQAKPQHVMATLEAILNESRNIPAYLPNIEALKEALNQAKEWSKKVDEIQNGEHFPYLDVLESMVVKGRPISVRLEQLPQVESQVAAARSWRERTARTFLKKNSPYSLVEVLSPRKDIGVIQTGKARRKKQKDLEKQREMEKEFATDVDPDETRDPSAFVARYKEFEQCEIDAMRVLRDKGRHKQQMEEEGAEQGKYCICHKGITGNMLQCEVCKDWFHSQCVPLPKSSSSSKNKFPLIGGGTGSHSARDIKFLCPLCLRSRRPRLETILSLLVSLQKLPVRLPEGEALQCLTERAMGWQDRARQALATEELASSLAKLSVMSQKLVEQAAREKTERIISAELKKAAKKPELQDHVQNISEIPLGGIPPTTKKGIPTEGIHKSSILHGMPPVPTNLSILKSDGLGMEGDGMPSDSGDNMDIGMEQNGDSEMQTNHGDAPIEHAYSASPAEHAYSSVSKTLQPQQHQPQQQQQTPTLPEKLPEKPPRKHPRKTPHVTRPMSSPVLELSEMAKAQLEDLMMEGDLLEVSLDETQHIWRILQACQPMHEDRFIELIEQQMPQEPEMKYMKPKLSALEKEKRKLKRKLKEEDMEAKYDPMKAAALALKLEKKKKKKNKEREKDRERKEIKKESLGLGHEHVKKEGKENKHVKLKELKIKMKKKKKKDHNKDDTKTKIKMGKDMIVNVDGDEEEENDEICSAKRCLQPTGDDINWVQCDKCEKWYHLFCIGMTKQPADDEDFICRICTKKKQKAAQYQAYKARLAQKKVDMDKATGYATKRSKEAHRFGSGAPMKIKQEPIDPSDIQDTKFSSMSMKPELFETVVPMETDEIVSVVSTPAENSPVGISASDTTMESMEVTTEEVTSGKPVGDRQLERIPEESDSIPSSIEKMLATVEKELDGVTEESIDDLLSSRASTPSSLGPDDDDNRSSSPITQVSTQEVSTQKVQPSMSEIRVSTPEVRVSTPELRVSTPEASVSMTEKRASTPEIRVPADFEMQTSLPEMKRAATPEIRMSTSQFKPSSSDTKAAVPETGICENHSEKDVPMKVLPQAVAVLSKEKATSANTVTPTATPPVLTPKKVSSPERSVSISHPAEEVIMPSLSTVAKDSQKILPSPVQQPIVPDSIQQAPSSPLQRDSSGSNSPNLEMPDIREKPCEISPVETTSLAPPSITKLSQRPSPLVKPAPPQENYTAPSIAKSVKEGLAQSLPLISPPSQIEGEYKATEQVSNSEKPGDVKELSSENNTLS